MNSSTSKGVPLIVVDKNGEEGTIIQEDVKAPGLDARVLVRFQDGEQVIVPSELLHRQADGRYRLSVSIEELLASQKRVEQSGASYQNSTIISGDSEAELPLIIPVTEESVRVETRTVEKGRVQLHKTVYEHTELVDYPLHVEEVEIERVPINQVVDEPVAVRYEGDTTIVPLLEEVLVVEKRLVLREEVHIKKLHKEVRAPQEVPLRQERIEINRIPASDQNSGQDEV